MTTITGKMSDEIDREFGETVSAVALDGQGQLTVTKKNGQTVSGGSVANSIVGAFINNLGRLILNTRQGSTIDAGSVGTKPIDSWPVGALFFSGVTTDPATLLGGGTWERYGVGKTFVSVDTSDPDFDAVGDTGGEKVHTLTVAEMPAHTHKEYPLNFQGSGSPYNGGYSATSNGNSTKTSDTTSTGGGQPHNNMPPYIAVYVWRRTA